MAYRLPLAKIRPLTQAEAIWVIVGFLLSLLVLGVVWRWLDRRGFRRGRTIPLFLLVVVVWGLSYPKLVT